MKRLIGLIALCLTSGAFALPPIERTERTVSVGRGLDTGLDAIAAANLATLPAADGKNGWLRIRGLGRPGERTQEIRAALLKLRANGWLRCVLLHWPADGQTEARTGGDNGGGGLPADLRAAFESSRRLGAVYGDLIDAWEVENEPDLGFVPASPENYAAYLKAFYLGLRAGSKEPGAKSPVVLMGALGLPPGPWLERFAANDGLGYTDGFSYHFYGYAEDFTGVYHCHENAVTELSKLSTPNTRRSTAVTKSLPVFLTEAGYGMLGKQTRETKEARLRQWRWFKSTGGQSDKLGISGTMAFLLTPYLERDTLEFGLTVPAKPAAKSEEQGAKSRASTSELWTAGGITYIASDFGAHAVEPWMGMTGKEIGGNQITPALAWWFAGPRKGGATRLPVDSHRWTVTTPTPSPVVIDFLAGDGVRPVKRFNGSFVTNLEPRPKQVSPPKGPGAYRQPPGEEFMIHVRTANGNLFEVYPTRMATPEWQGYLEAQGNFTMSFYGRAELPWRFRDNRPVSLVVVMYPKQLPTTYEFRRAQLIKLAAPSSQLPAAARYGQGQIILYNFSDKPVIGKLNLPEIFAASFADQANGRQSVELQPGERRELNVIIKVPADRFERTEAAITFVPEDKGISPARFVTEFFPALEGLPAMVVADLTKPLATSYTASAEGGKRVGRVDHRASKNREVIANRQLAMEEAKGILQPATGFFAQQGAQVERTVDGFRVTVTGAPPGKAQRVEVELPWPDGLEFKPEEFLSLEFRLGPGP